MKTLVILISVLAAIMTVVPNAFSYMPSNAKVNGDGDALPWPWGTECPFPWGDIQGVWVAKAADDSGKAADKASGYYQFKVVSEWSNGTKVFEVTKFNQLGLLIGQGKAYSPSGQKIVRAVVLADEGVDMPNHRVIVRAYTETATHSCSENLITVLTTRAMSGDRSQDSHYILSKLEPGSSEAEK